MRSRKSCIARGLAIAASLLLAAPALAQTLQVHLSLDGDVTDATGNGFDGTLMEGLLGSGRYVEGPIGQALKLDHDPATLTSDMTEGAYVSVPYTLTEEGSIVFWYRVSPYYNYQNLWDNSGQQDDFEMWIYTDGSLRARIDGNVGQVTHQLESFNRWYHIAYTWKKGDQARLWVDGIERDTESAIRAITDEQFDLAILGDTFFLGGGNAGNTYANGAYDDFRIYDGALEEADVQAIMALGDPPEEPEEPPAELILKWDLDGDEEDSSGNGNDGQLVVGFLGDFSYVEGPIGQALKLDHDPATLSAPGGDTIDGAYVSVPLTLPEAGTITLWYRVTDLYNYQTIFDNSGNADDWEMWIYGDGILRGRIDGDVGQVSYQLPEIHKWYHIAYTWRKGAEARLWVDGVERDTGSGLRAITEEQFDLAILGDTFYLGGGNEGNNYGVGAFDDVRIYDGRLDEAAIQAIMAEGDPPDVEPGPGDEPELRIHWNFEDDLTDASGNGYDGNLAVGALGDFSYVDGPVGKALDLDHDLATLTSDMIDGAYVWVQYTLTESGSIVLWYRPDPYYNYQSIWDNSGDANDFEMWIYDTGILRGRVDAEVGQVSHQLDRPGKWYHIAYTWRRGDKARLWVDGVERDTDSAIRTIAASQFDAAILGDTFYLGGGNPGNVFATGVFDDFRIYEGALDEAAIQEIMAEGDPPDEPPLEPVDPGPPTVHWPLDGNFSNIGTLGPAYDGVLIEGAIGSPTFVPGAVGEGLSLDHGDGGTPAVGGSYVQVINPLSEQGTIALWYYARDYYNYQTIWDNSVFENDWEMWIYNDGRVRARVAQTPASGMVTYDLDELDGPNHWYHIAYTWDQAESIANLFVNSVLVSSSVISTWVDPGELFYLAGGNDGNNYGNGVWDDVRIYDHALTEGEVLFVMQGSVTCPEEGDTHCDELVIDPEGGAPGAYQAISFASDESGDPVIYTFRADNGVDPAILIGPQRENVAEFDLTEGTWTISVTVDDNLVCEDLADDATCSQVIVVRPGGAPIFHRGDADDNGSLQLTDAIRILGWLYLGGAIPPCLDAADADNSGQIQLTDAIRILQYLYLGGQPPAPPGPPEGNACGPDDGTSLGCESYTHCE
ncbi:MAG: hypothetical protein JXA90_14205 [Planctomycetes bacterium]|nr:hypothetical protein [Planctomycetota bacterium]